MSVDVGYDQLRVPNFSLYGMFFQVGTIYDSANDGCLKNDRSIDEDPPPWP